MGLFIIILLIISSFMIALFGVIIIVRIISFIFRSNPKACQSRAIVVDKRKERVELPNGILGAYYYEYYIAFKTIKDELVELKTSKSIYKKIKPDDRVTILYKGTELVSFNK